MPIYKESQKMGSIYVGGSKIKAVYKGSALVYQGVAPIDQWCSGDSMFTLTRPKVGSHYLMGINQATLSSITGTIGEEGSIITGVSPTGGNFTAGYSHPIGDTSVYQTPKDLDGRIFYPYLYRYRVGSVNTFMVLWLSPNQQVGDIILEERSSLTFPFGPFTNVKENSDGTISATTFPEEYWDQSWVWYTYENKPKFLDYVYR